MAAKISQNVFVAAKILTLKNTDQRFCQVAATQSASGAYIWLKYSKFKITKWSFGTEVAQTQMLLCSKFSAKYAVE